MELFEHKFLNGIIFMCLNFVTSSPYESFYLCCICCYLNCIFMCISFIVKGPCPFEDDFKCSDGKCVRSDEVCNGKFDCKDEKDELNCNS